MLQIVVAPPRSGKTYFVVNYLLKFCTFDLLYNEYILAPNVLIISNIEGLRVRHWSLVECLKKKSIVEFFSIENFENIMLKTGKNHIILCIDEAHDFFPKGFSEPSVYSFFAYHGHIGLDCFFMTQGVEEFTRSFNPLFELRIEVTIRSKSLPLVFKYDSKTKEGRYLYTSSLVKKKETFGAYKSFRVDEINKPKNALMMWALMSVFIIGGAFGIFKLALGTVHAKSEAAAAKQAVAFKPMDMNKSKEVAASPIVPVVASMASPAPPDARLIQAWRVYHVQGYIDNGERRGYLVHGRVVMAGVCRNYDSMTSSVECFGGEIPEQRGGFTPPPGAGGSGLVARLGDEG